MKPAIIIALAAICLVASCHNSASEAAVDKKFPEAITVPQEDKLFDSGDGSPDTSKKMQTSIQPKTAGTQDSRIDWDKKIVKTADINIEVGNYKGFNESLHADIKRFGGYVASELQNQTDYQIENAISIKVPVAQFDDFVTAITTGDQKVIEKKISTEDVTSEVVDTKARLEAKRQVRLKYLELLKGAKNMNDIMNVQGEINGIQEDIEAATGRVDYLSHSASYSTVNLTFHQVLDPAAKNVTDVPYSTKLWQSFKNGWGWVGDVLVGIISIWPLLLLGFACWFACRRWLVSKAPKKNA